MVASSRRHCERGMFPIYSDLTRRTFPALTFGIIALNLLLFAGWQERIGMRASVLSGGLVPAELLRGSHPVGVIHLFTHMFLHAGWMHLLGNMWFLWVFGQHVEDAIGRVRYLLFYLICGVAAAWTHVYFSHLSRLPLVGASGAISGVLGAYLVLFPRSKVDEHHSAFHHLARDRGACRGVPAALDGVANLRRGRYLRHAAPVGRRGLSGAHRRIRDRRAAAAARPPRASGRRWRGVIFQVYKPGGSSNLFSHMATPRKTRLKIGVIGLGIIGSRVAANLRAAGHQVYVWSRSPHSAPNFLGSVVEVADLCDIIQIFVSDEAALLEVTRTMAAALGPRHVVTVHATISPDAARRTASIIESLGARYLDAPFTGSKVAAQNGQLVYYVGGSEEALGEVRPALEASSKKILHVGGIGDASVLKIATNMLTATTVQTLAEALALVRSAGVDGAMLVQALENNASRSGTSDLKLPTMLAQNFEPNFSLKHMLKDVRLAKELAEKGHIKMPVTESTGGCPCSIDGKRLGRRRFFGASCTQLRPPAARESRFNRRGSSRGHRTWQGERFARIRLRRPRQAKRRRRILRKSRSLRRENPHRRPTRTFLSPAKPW